MCVLYSMDEGLQMEEDGKAIYTFVHIFVCVCVCIIIFVFLCIVCVCMCVRDSRETLTGVLNQKEHMVDWTMSGGSEQQYSSSFI